MKVIEKDQINAKLQFPFASEEYPKGKKYLFNYAVSEYTDEQLTSFTEALKLLIDGSFMGQIDVVATTRVTTIEE